MNTLNLKNCVRRIGFLALLTLSSISQAELVNNGALDRASAINGIYGINNSLSYLPSGWQNLTTGSSHSSPDVLDATHFYNAANVNDTSLFGTTPTASPNGGTWVGMARDNQNLNEGFYQEISNFEVNKTYKLSWFDANFGYFQKTQNAVNDISYKNTNAFVATLTGASNPITDTMTFNGNNNDFGAGWDTQSFTFTPKQTQYKLSFYLQSATPSYLSIDGISITQIAAVPEPSTWAFMLMGVLMISFQARKKKMY